VRVSRAEPRFSTPSNVGAEMSAAVMEIMIEQLVSSARDDATRLGGAA
jgi:hypothetical protein